MPRFVTDLIDNARFLIDLAADVLAAVGRRPTAGSGFRIG
jgi:hypothetical protein